jgi:glycosyltransferase involved in cell wall biosynthesis
VVGDRARGATGDPMRLIITTDAVGGVWQYTATLADGLAEQYNAHVMLVVCGRPPNSAQLEGLRLGSRPKGGMVQMEHADVPLEWEGATHRLYEAARQHILDLALRWGAHLVHANEHYLGEMGVSGMPVVVVSHSDLCSWRAHVLSEVAPVVDQAYTHRLRSGLAAAAAVVAPSLMVAEALGRWYSYSGVVRLIANGVGPHKTGFPVVRSLDVIMVGRLWDNAKNLACFAGMASGMPDHVCVAVGDTVGPQGPIDVGASSYVQFVGALSHADVRAYMSRSRVFVSAAFYDPFGLAAVEAAMAGCSLVLSDIPSYRAIWADCAAYFDPSNSHALRRQVEAMLDDENSRAAMAERAAQRARELYSAERMTTSYMALYQRLAHRHGLAG